MSKDSSTSKRKIGLARESQGRDSRGEPDEPEVLLSISGEVTAMLDADRAQQASQETMLEQQGVSGHAEETAMVRELNAMKEAETATSIAQ